MRIAGKQEVIVWQLHAYNLLSNHSCQDAHSTDTDAVKAHYARTAQNAKVTVIVQNVKVTKLHAAPSLACLDLFDKKNKKQSFLKGIRENFKKYFTFTAVQA